MGHYRTRPRNRLHARSTKRLRVDSGWRHTGRAIRSRTSHRVRDGRRISVDPGLVAAAAGLQRIDARLVEPISMSCGARRVATVGRTTRGWRLRRGTSGRQLPQMPA
jgi:hypothetical protein